METFFTVSQIAKAMQVSEDTVREWLRTKRLGGIKVGRTWRIPETEIQRLKSGAEAS